MEILPFLKREEVTQSATSLSKLTQCIPVFIMIRPKVVEKKFPLKEDLHSVGYTGTFIVAIVFLFPDRQRWRKMK